ncbi:CBF-domain-containing protein [Wilcoxina mikolae CBS 423.85]|nr:CBF-domain-containing protein [Wilcoxina mikolae CBS 423.85]
MPSTAGVKSPSSKKRKLSAVTTIADTNGKKSAKKLSTKSKALNKTSATSQEAILELEDAIVESPKNYNNIVTLLGHFKDCLDTDQQTAVITAVSLCRTFCRLMAKGRLLKRKGNTEEETTTVVWLKERYKEYIAELCASLNNDESGVQNTALTLLMRLVKEEGTHVVPEGEAYYFPNDTFYKIVRGVVAADNMDEEVKREWVEKYVDVYDDVRYSFFTAIKRLVDEHEDQGIPEALLTGATDLLLLLKNLPTVDTTEIDNFYTLTLPTKPSRKSKAPTLLSPSAHRRVVQEAWCSILRQPLPPTLCKSVLLTAERRIVPSFIKPQLLMDFLIACYDHGGTISLLALNGLFHLISIKNLDYPNFFTKLYGLLDRNLFHVRYRSRFFRLLETFLASTHLPATLIASFIKKMSRLCLSAPPGAIVVVVPFVYNLFKKHKATTYMMHRIPVDAEEAEEWRVNGYEDPFDEEETDPLQTRAIESCVWELETLMSHWHPNVATLCRIMKEQFTKERYQLEDFLDHSYGSMFDVETNRELKKAPVVEVDIPKKIFFRVEGQETGETGNALLDLWNFE